MLQNAIELSRAMLSQLRDIMSSAGEDEERLQQLVEQIAHHMRIDVCSVYVLRAGEVLELYATTGLQQEAIHQTRLRVGEGLVGLTAATKLPQNHADISHHPDFVLRPETGEEYLQSFLGVPILRQERVIGVLVVQSRQLRVFPQDIVEILQNIAMFLAEFFVATDISNRTEILSTQGLNSGPVILRGNSIHDGVAVGKAVLHQPALTVASILAEDTDFEHKKFSQALKEMHLAIDDMLNLDITEEVGEHTEVLETYALIAKDAGWIRQIREAIDEGLSATAAVKKVTNTIKNRLSAAKDPYLRERAMDFEDLGDRVMHHLAPNIYKTEFDKETDNIILFARTIGPARLLDYDHKKLKGLVLVEASKHSHVAIIAKGLNIPVLGLAADAYAQVENGDDVCLDSHHGHLILRADDEVAENFRDSIKNYEQHVHNSLSLQEKPAITLDGKRISLRMNAGLRSDMSHFKRIKPNGVGLMRTEVPFMIRSHLPDVAVQKRIYQEILKDARGKPVVFRTLDVGGDKVLPWRKAVDEENPAMGWRAVRVSNDIPALIRNQLKALVQAAEGQELRILFPMVTEMHEWYFCRDILYQEIEKHKQKTGQQPSAIKVGIMFEVPALILQLDEMLNAVDFISIGSNDLTQFLFAADRGSRMVSERYDPISPVMLNFYKSLLEKARVKNIPVTLCGEMAADPLGALALIAIGFDRLSMTPFSIPAIRDMIYSTPLKPLQQWLEKQLLSKNQASLRKHLKSWAIDHNIYLP